MKEYEKRGLRGKEMVQGSEISEIKVKRIIKVLKSEKLVRRIEDMTPGETYNITRTSFVVVHM